MPDWCTDEIPLQYPNSDGALRRYASMAISSGGEVSGQFLAQCSESEIPQWVDDRAVVSLHVRSETMDRIRDPRGVLLSARKALKMEWVGFHDFRHFRATQWVKQGIDLRTVQELLGHRDITAEGEPFLLAGGESGSVTA